MHLPIEKKGFAGWCRLLLGDRTGAIAIEGAIAISVAVAVMLPLIDFGQYINLRIDLKQALRAGGQYALHDVNNLLGDTTAVATSKATIQSVVQTASGLTSTVTVVVGKLRCLCGTTSTTCPGQSGYQVCSTTLVSPAVYVDMTASAAFDPYFAFLGFFTEGMTVTEELTMRIR